jgi:hypothetical protein
MVYDPFSLLILKFRGRGVAVLRDSCSDYDVSRPHHDMLLPPTQGLSSDTDCGNQ